ncbi:TadE/TadG family type IV pilus assembly protein [Methylorubrum zatmanii]|uniref:TadE/TadG family type IV pilus assembly protein n=1 Tax=Methylorubrum zatmanii TaxID=29429 RepID=A0ABW1WT05_9HYPH|nr:TadE/TadG family type IV pilus assembly protein [Methylorubrum zatmanii]MBD8907231.1 pilus assembly protein TadE [Methylorubrum zatmanii]
MRQISGYVKDERGATTVEFALIGATFLLTMMFAMATALVLYINQVLDTATTRAARQILTGSLQSQSTPPTLASFKQSLCAYLPATMSCNDVIVNLYIVPEAAQPSGYYTYVKADLSGLALPDVNTGSGQFNLGVRGAYQYLQVIYPITFLPRIVSSWLSGGATYNGKPAYLAVSAAAFRNEQY